jgi:Tc5 transposase DNA-binding domain
MRYGRGRNSPGNDREFFLQHILAITMPSATTSESKRKVRGPLKPYERKPRVKAAKDAPRTAAKTQKDDLRENLTLHDWLVVFRYMDDHPKESQSNVVAYFRSLRDGSLHFDQSTLSRNLKKRQELENRAASFPTALSQKRQRIVTRPDVERSLLLWVRHMEDKNETVSGPMLKEKRARIEEALNVPDAERLKGEGWVANFCRAYVYDQITQQLQESDSISINQV